MENEREYLKVPEVAAILQIARSRAYELVATGAIPGAVKIGRSVRVSREELDRWLEDQRVPEVARWRGR